MRATMAMAMVVASTGMVRAQESPIPPPIVAPAPAVRWGADNLVGEQLLENAQHNKRAGTALMITGVVGLVSGAIGIGLFVGVQKTCSPVTTCIGEGLIVDSLLLLGVSGLAAGIPIYVRGRRQEAQIAPIRVAATGMQVQF